MPHPSGLTCDLLEALPVLNLLCLRIHAVDYERLSCCLSKMSRLQELCIWQIKASSSRQLAPGLADVAPRITTLALTIEDCASPLGTGRPEGLFSALFPGDAASAHKPPFHLMSLHLENMHLPDWTFTMFAPEDLQSLRLNECTIGFRQLPLLPQVKELTISIDFNDRVSSPVLENVVPLSKIQELLDSFLQVSLSNLDNLESLDVDITSSLSPVMDGIEEVDDVVEEWAESKASPIMSYPFPTSTITVPSFAAFVLHSSYPDSPLSFFPLPPSIVDEQETMEDDYFRAREWTVEKLPVERWPHIRHYSIKGWSGSYEANFECEKWRWIHESETWHWMDNNV
jgi:hypothetical protein